jgi:hypothetical protein
VEDADRVPMDAAKCGARNSKGYQYTDIAMKISQRWFPESAAARARKTSRHQEDDKTAAGRKQPAGLATLELGTYTSISRVPVRQMGQLDHSKDYPPHLDQLGTVLDGCAGPAHCFCGLTVPTRRGSRPLFRACTIVLPSPRSAASPVRGMINAALIEAREKVSLEYHYWGARALEDEFALR